MTVYNAETIARYAAKATHPDPESREGKLLEVIRKEVGAPRLPTYEEVFASHFSHNLPAVGLDELAVFNDNNGWDEAATALGRVMKQVAAAFGGDNFLNPYAEVDPSRVVQILGKIIRMGKLYNPIKAFKIDANDARTKKKMGISKYQVFDGRNRMVALAVLFGPQLRIPMWIDTETKSRALSATLDMNNVRKTKNLERVAVTVVSSMAAHASPADGFKAMNGNIKKIATWTAGHTHILKTKVFDRVGFQVIERVTRGVYAIPTTGYQDMLKGSVRLMPREACYDLEKFGPLVNKVLAGVDSLYNSIAKSDETGDLRGYFTAYSCPAFGTLLGDMIFVGGLPPESAGKVLADKAAEYLKANGPDDFARIPPSALVDKIRATAS